MSRLWRKWSPGYRADEDHRHVVSAIGAPDRWRAALGYYRAVARSPKARPRRQLCHSRLRALVKKVLPDGSEVAIVERAGHFLQLDQLDIVGRHIAEFIGRAG